MLLRTALLALAGLVIAASCLPAQEIPQPIRILLITGGCCHDYDAQKQLIAKGLEERALVDVEVVQQGGSATDSKIEVYERENWAEGYDLVIHDECFSDVKDRAWVDKILKPHRAGLPGVVIHCAMHCYRDGREDWFKFCGVTSHRHGAHYAHEVLNRDAGHPIMQGFPAGWANPAGELYWIEKLGVHTHPLAAAKNREQGNEEVCVWTNQFEQARVFGTTLGHHNETVSSPEFLDLLARGVLWAVNKIDDPRYLKTSAQTPKLVPVNLAQGKTVLASSEETGKNNFAPLAVDGNPATRWCAANGSAPQWLQIDLGQVQAVNGCELKWESDQTVYKYIVEGSVDGTTWTMLADESQQGRNGLHELAFVANARFLKVTFLGSNTGGWGSISEAKVFGDELITVDPAVAAQQADAAVLADVSVPAEFDVTLFAKPPAVEYPVFVAAAPDGTVYVSVDKNGSLDREGNRGAIYRLRDLDGDGRADESKLFVANVDSPRGLVWDHDRLYVMHPPHLSAFIDHDGDGIADEQQVLVKNIAFDFKDRPADHTSNGVTLGIDGWLYLAIGDFGFMQAEGADGTKLQFRSGGVVRVRPDGSKLEVYSRGTRNILEVALDPLLNGFTRDNTNDGGGWDIRLHHFSGLEHHGYPSLYMNFGEEIVQPLADYGGGSGCGALYLDEPGFPAGYGNALYTADWGRSIVYRHNMTALGATFQADQHEFLKSTRVTDLDVDASGHLYVTSWKGATFTYAGDDVGYLIRVTPKEHLAEPLPDFNTLSRAQLVEQLLSPSHRRRLEAQRTLLRTGVDQSTEQALQQLCLNEQAPLASRVAALYALKQCRGVAAHELLAQTGIRSAAMRPFAARALGDRAGIGAPWKVAAQDALPLVIDPAAPMSLDGVAIGLHSDDARTRLEAVIAIGRLHLIDIAGELTKLLDDADPIVAHTTVHALVLLGASDASFTVVDESGPVGPKRLGALRVLSSLHTPDVVHGLIQRLAYERQSDRRQGLLTALCRLYHVEGEWKGNSWGTRPDTTGPYYQPETWAQSETIRKSLQQTVDQATGAEAAFLLQQLNRHRVQLDGTLEKVLGMTSQNPELLPIAVGELSRTSSIPVVAISLLTQVSQDAAAAPELRSMAAQTLLRTSAPEAFSVAFATLVDLDQRQRGQAPGNQLWDKLKSPQILGAAVQQLATQAAGDDAEAGRWADAGLLLLTANADIAPDVREVANKSLDTGWTVAPRRARILEAAVLANFRFYEDQVLAALTDSDPAVRQAATAAAKRWQLEAQPTPAGPALKELQIADIMQLALEKTGNAGRGEYLFTRLNCAKCHTVKKGEPLRGPYLPQVVKTYKREQLVEAILLPSKTLAQGFVTEIFQMDDGKTFTGFVTSESAEAIVIRDIDAKELTLDPNEIEARKKDTKSIMPEGLVKDLTLADFVSLLDYLQGLKE